MVSTREFLRQYNLRPKQSLAQNFLVDETHLARIAAAATLDQTDTVLEIGPGPGSLTTHLAAQAGRVVAVELDDRFIEPLQTHFAAQPHVTIVHGDILELDPGALIDDARQEAGDRRQETGEPRQENRALSNEADCADGSQSVTRNTQHTTRTTQPYKVVANLPYYITSAVLRHLLEATLPPTVIVVLVQKEVAERICAQPGDLSILAISVQYYAKPTLVHQVPASAFYPPPKVDSAVLRLDCYPTPAVPDVATDQFFRVVRAGFSQKRKQLVNTLSAGLHLAKADATAILTAANIDPKRRAETLTLAEWGILCNVFADSQSMA
jgi:16S rRNA (adenine1518-N6/adenine1519-N6)-dimethyltransferase